MLFDVRNALHIGNYQTCVAEAEKLQVRTKRKRKWKWLFGFQRCYTDGQSLLHVR